MMSKNAEHRVGSTSGLSGAHRNPSGSGYGLAPLAVTDVAVTPAESVQEDHKLHVRVGDASPQESATEPGPLVPEVQGALSGPGRMASDAVPSAGTVPFDVWLTFRRLDYRLALIHADLACDAANLHNSRARVLRCYWRLLDEARAQYRQGVQ